jgi:voltage-gated potassium channel Kch
MAPRPRMISIMLVMLLRLEFRMLNNMLKRLLIVFGTSSRLGFIEFIHFCGLLICGLLDFLSSYSQFLDFSGILLSIYLLISFGPVEIYG